MADGWSTILEEARAARGRLPYALRAYSEFMPPPYVGVKPYGEPDPFTVPEGDDHGWNVSEYEWHFEIRPGIERIATRVLEQVVKLARGEPTQFSARMLEDNPAWTPALAARAGSIECESFTLMLPVALSKTQDDKGRVRWTLLGTCGDLLPSDPLWSSYQETEDVDRPDAMQRLLELLSWSLSLDARSIRDPYEAGVRILPHHGTKLPAFVRDLELRPEDPLDRCRFLLTYVMFGDLPARIQWAYVEGRLRIVPHPASHVFWGHTGYRRLCESVWDGRGIPLLHLFPRSGANAPIRIPQSGWLDEVSDEREPARDRHRRENRIQRTHRWQRVLRDQEDRDDPVLEDRVTAALFSAAPDSVHLYGKPMARNCQVWNESYEALLDGPRADRDAIRRAAEMCCSGGRFGYRMCFPTMRAGDHSAVWYLPVVARWTEDLGTEVRRAPLPGVILAGHASGYEVELRPRLLDRPQCIDSIELFQQEPADARQTGNCRRLLEWRELLQRPLPPTFARALLDAAKEEGFDEWLAKLPSRSNDPARATGLVDSIRGLLAAEEDVGPAFTFDLTQTRDFEERYWKTIASLTEGDLLGKNNADVVTVNAGRTGGPKAAAAQTKPTVANDLDRLADRLHEHYDGLIQKHGLEGRAVCADHRFKWETDFDFSWSDSWRQNQTGERLERNVVLVIPGKNRSETVIMADHYDTAYMEDVYDPARGGDHLRAAAAGADDNHSATAALMLAADVFLPLAREGRLERDIWLVHLTGEEFPADCLGARALASALVEAQGDGELVLECPGGRSLDVTKTRVVGACILDMVAHNRDNDRDVFQIAPGEGRSSARLAYTAWRANQRWNRDVKAWNQAADRHGKGRGRRSESGAQAPPIAEHLALLGEVRPEWDPRSALYNTDGQIFSDLGIPVVLFMENYDIRRSGYHDTQDTMKNIDLDYGAALVAIAIESVAEAAGALPSA